MGVDRRDWKLLAVPSVAASEWVTALFPGRSPAELPIAGRRIIDYGIEHAVQSGLHDIEILDHHWLGNLAAEFADPETKGYDVKYSRGDGSPPKGLDDLESVFEHGYPDGLCVAWGLCLSGHALGEMSIKPLEEPLCADTPAGIYQWRHGRWNAVYPHGVAVSDVKSWHRVNLAVLHDPVIFTLPGYSAEKGVHLGRNVVLEHGTEVKPPVILQDDTWCGRLVQLDGDVIVGRGSFVAEGAHLRRTVIGNDTYIGTGLVLEDKIVIGHRIIDAKSGEWTDVEDPGIARSIGDGFGFLGAIWKFLVGASHRGRN